MALFHWHKGTALYCEQMFLYNKKKEPPDVMAKNGP